ncbi:hypothetical protein AB0A69_16725 [Streptomyces sp. NPDC045431]|uniref:hypothetical protein n=1 Tax=Streptomyces sp. NPDC045431 TaxID=3155613 RepID=UPI0033D98CD9
MSNPDAEEVFIFDRRMVLIEKINQGLSDNPEALAKWMELVDRHFPFFRVTLREAARWQALRECRIENILSVLERRALDVTDDTRERIADCFDPDLLLRWFDRALTATSAEEIFTDA